MDNIEKHIKKQIEIIEKSINETYAKIHESKDNDKTLILIESLDAEKWRFEQFINDLGKY